MTTRRTTQWFTREQQLSNLGPSAVTNLGLYSQGIHGDRFETKSIVTRMIIDLTFTGDTIAQRGRTYWGIVVVNAVARAAAAFPDPEDVIDRASWLVRGCEHFNQDSLPDRSQWARVQLDLRAQRVLRSEEDELQLIVSNAGTGFSVIWSAFIRTLVKMP